MGNIFFFIRWVSMIVYEEIIDEISGFFSIVTVGLYFFIASILYGLNIFLDFKYENKVPLSWAVELLNSSTLGCASFGSLLFFYNIYQFFNNNYDSPRF